MADPKFTSAQTASAEAHVETAVDDLAAQIAALREDLTRLTQSVAAVGQGAKSVVTEEAQEITERVREKVREEPIFVLAAVAGVAYMIGLLSRR